jgi:hypothetical protein
MPAVLSVPQRRLRRKTWLGFHIVADELEEVIPEPPPLLCYLEEEGLEQEDCSRTKQVYLVTFPALRRALGQSNARGFVCPSTWSHEDLARVVLKAFRSPLYTTNNKNWGTKLELDCFVIFREHHAAINDEAEGLVHWHVALKATACFRFLPYKRALSVNHGLATHWSCSHTGYWSAVRYGYMPSAKKPQEELDPTPYTWCRAGEHLPLFQVAQEPTTAAALQRRREHKVKESCSKGKPEPRPTEMDLYPLVVQQGFRNTADDHTAAEKLVQFLKNYGSPALVAFAFKNRSKLHDLIDDVWSWETVDDFLSHHGQTRLQLLERAAQMQCICNGVWAQRTEMSLHMNGINPRSLFSDVLRSLESGRREDVPVLVLMGRFGGEGKSFILSPLQNVYGIENLQCAPQPGNFPLLGLEKKKVVMLDDWCFNTAVLPLPTQLLWYEGKAFPLTRPQNKDYAGHLLYRGTAPIFVTCKEKDLEPIIAQARLAFSEGKPSEHTMLLRRLRIYSFTCPLPPLPENVKHIPECPGCFARLVLQHGRIAM